MSTKHGGEDSSYKTSHESSSAVEDTDDRVIPITEDDEQEPLIQIVECRICQEEDSIKNLESPCACSGSLKFAHRKCVQRWCNEKGDTICEICNQPYQSGYTAPPPHPHSEETMIDISEGLILDFRDPRILAMAAAEHRFREAEYDEYSDNNTSGASFCRSVVLILMALLLMRHTLYLTSDNSGEDDDSTSFTLFLLRAAGFLLPFYIMAWAISIIQQRRQRQEAAALAAAEAALMQHHSLQITIEPAAPPHNQPQSQPQTVL
jgi:hypothetical protein